MKRYTVQEYARLTGKTPYTIYKGKRYQPYTTVVNSVKYIEIPSDIDPLTLKPFNTVANSVDNGSQPVVNTIDNPVEAASNPANDRDLTRSIEALTAEKNLLQTQLDGLKGILAAKDETITTLQQRIAYMEGQLQQQMEVVNRLTLPAPKKSLGERVKAALGIKPKTP